MENQNNLTSLNLERHFLSGLLKFKQETFCEVDSFISENDFTDKDKIHATLFLILKQLITNNQTFDKVIVAQKMIEIGISNYSGINIHDYLDDLSYSQITKQGTIDAAKELIKLRVRRELCQNAESEKKFILENADKPINQLILEVDKIHNNHISSYQSDEEPQDLYSSLEQYIRQIAENPISEVGLVTPFTQFNKYFGGLKSGDGVYFFCGRAGEGKSVLLFNFAKGVFQLNDCPILYIDTEMSKDMNMIRAAAAEANVNSWYLQTGNWVKNKELSNKVLSSFNQINKFKNKFYHKYFPNKDIYETASLIKKWYYKIVGRGNKCLIVYDYLKITTDVDKNRQEWQQLGDKISVLNEVGSDLNVPILCAGQQNRTGEQNGVRLDDSTTIGGSDRINHYARFNAIFRRKSLDEISEQGSQFGSHLLRPVKWSRDQGVDDYNNHAIIKTIDNQGKTKYKQNYINFMIQNYAIKDVGTLEDIVANHNFHHNLQKGSDLKHKDGSLDI